MNSANHFEKIIAKTRTELVEILEGAKDTIFTVVFNKKVKAEEIVYKIRDIKAKEFKDAKYLKKLSQGILDGEECTITGRLSSAKGIFGRTMVIDLKAKGGFGVR